MNTFTLSGSDLASRRIAAVDREDFVNRYWGEGSVVIDLSAVQSVSESYADEFFGVLVLRFGLAAVLSKVKIANARETVLRAVANSMRRRDSTVSVAA